MKSIHSHFLSTDTVHSITYHIGKRTKVYYMNTNLLK